MSPDVAPQVKLYYDGPSYQLIVTIMAGLHLLPRDNGQPRNPYCKMYLLPERRCVTVVYFRFRLKVVNELIWSGLHNKLLKPLAQGASRFEKLLARKKSYWPEKITGLNFRNQRRGLHTEHD